ncbi:MAG: ATP-binding cassette domain-containing protein [Cypionkella sp.]
MGPSGAGKSTLLELLPRFIEPNAGRIEIDGQDIANMPLAALRAKIGLVTQVPYLFAGSLMDNLRAASPGAKPDAVAEAVRLARVDEFAHRLPQGLDSLIESGGTNLSVGQRQRIALARVFLKDPPILLLDEPTSALDAASERFVADAIVQAAANRTTITVAHRLSTVRDADRVVVLDAGRIVEIGTHAHLLAQGGAFAGLTRASAVVAS